MFLISATFTEIAKKEAKIYHVDTVIKLAQINSYMCICLNQLESRDFLRVQDL